MADHLDQLEPMGMHVVIAGRSYHVDDLVGGRDLHVGDTAPRGVQVFERGFGRGGRGTSAPEPVVEMRYQVAWEAQVDGVWAGVGMKTDGSAAVISFDPAVAGQPGWEGEKYNGWTRDVDLTEVPVRARRVTVRAGTLMAETGPEPD